MNNTVTLSQLITRLAKATGTDNNTTRRFLRSFFDTVEETLESGQSVTIKNIGTFRRVDTSDPGSKGPVSFVPDPAILEELNRPFEMFEAVELADGVDFSELDKKEEEIPVVIEEKEEAPVFFEQPSEPVIMGEEKVDETLSEPVKEAEPVQEPEAEHQPEPEPAPVKEPVKAGLTIEDDAPVFHFADDEEEEAPVPEKPRKPRRKSSSRREEKKKLPMWVWAILIVLCTCGIGFIFAVFTTPLPNGEYDVEVPEPIPGDTAVIVLNEEGQHEEAAAAPEEAAPAPVVAPVPEPVKPEPKAAEPVYDTVQISLIRLAKKHYGVPEYWVFIFEANRDKISNPNTIRPGTRVLIPDSSSFPGSSKEETKSIAKQKQSEYQRKFN